MSFRLVKVQQHQDCTVEYNLFPETHMTVRGVIDIYAATLLRRKFVGFVAFKGTNAGETNLLEDDETVLDRDVTSAKMHTTGYDHRRAYTILFQGDSKYE